MLMRRRDTISNHLSTKRVSSERIHVPNIVAMFFGYASDDIGTAVLLWIKGKSGNETDDLRSAALPDLL